MPLPDYIDPGDLDLLIAAWLAEDVGSGDVTTEATIPAGCMAEAHFVVKEEGIIAGIDVASRVFHRVDTSLNVSFSARDGESVRAGTTVGSVRGNAASIMVAERLALNVMQRMSGVASATARMVGAVGQSGCHILDTRKTAPGLRFLDKWAVLLGGGQNHRVGLFDMILIKDNHVDASGGMANAVRSALSYRAKHNPDLKIEVETRTLDEVREVLGFNGIDRILLDNMVTVSDGVVDTSRLAEAVTLVDGRVETEASGNVTEATVSAIAKTGVDFISSGALTHSVRALDISLRVVIH